MIPVVDLANQSVSFRPDDTRTLDLPRDFDRQMATASLDAGSHVRCSSNDGRALLYRAFTTPLSSRRGGEECLVADRAFRATVARPGNYRLSTVKPTHD
jgi:hypothetical protein